MRELQIVEYNWKERRFRAESVQMRLEKNITAVLRDGQPRNPDWILVGVCWEGQQFDYIEALGQRMEREGSPSPRQNPGLPAADRAAQSAARPSALRRLPAEHPSSILHQSASQKARSILAKGVKTYAD